MTDVGTAISKRLLVISVLPFCHIIGLPDLQCRNLERFFDRKTLNGIVVFFLMIFIYFCFIVMSYFIFYFNLEEFVSIMILSQQLLELEPVGMSQYRLTFKLCLLM
jgi:hypothetical protein